jgi:hypothetical protein
MTQRLLLGNLAAFFLPLFAMAAQTPDWKALNEAFGLSLWADNNLWDDPDIEVGKRLNWPLESRTSTDLSSRLYAKQDARVLGARPYSLAFYGRNGVADRLSMVFANKGDVGSKDPFGGRIDYKKSIAADAQAIDEVLTHLLGPAKADQFGSGAKTRERVERWDWKGHTILLAAPRGEYVAVRIIPTSIADASAAPRINDSEMAARLKTRVVKRPSGDVLLKDIPMVDQGPKGYCVPATWERALRYMDIPADMYALAMAAQTAADGGTSINTMLGAVSEIVARSGRRLIPTGGRLTTQSVSRFIDQGTPILWGMFVDPELEISLTTRARARRQTTDWSAYKATLKPFRKDARRIHNDPENAHMCMIIGYNSGTGEICITDSWGPQYAERWITEEEANAITMGDLTVIGK